MMDDSVGIDDINLTLNEYPLDNIPLANKKRSRTSNYLTQEDEALVSAWESVTLDPVAGIDQNSCTYWTCITEQYHRNINSPRTMSSLQHCRGTILVCCNRWAGCIEAVELNRSSGTTIQDEVPIAQVLYKQRDTKKHKNFAMFHCWQLLKDNEKWRSRNGQPITKKSKSPGDDEDLEEDEEGEEERGRSPAPSSRTPGRKQEKERLKKQDKGAVYKEMMQETIISKKELEAEKDENLMAHRGTQGGNR